MDCNVQNNERIKLSKAQKKALRKQQRAKRILDRHNVLNEFKVSDQPSRHLLISNGGLGCGITRTILTSVFGRYGQITNIIMLPDKPFSVLSYQTVTDAKQAYDNIHAIELITFCDTDVKYLVKSGIKAFILNYLEDYFCETNKDSNLGYPEGLLLIQNYVSEQEEDELLQSIGWYTNHGQASHDTHPCQTVQSDRESMQRRLKHRHVKHYGYEFRYDTNTVDKDKPLHATIPSKCRYICQRMTDDGYIQHQPDQLTVNEYMPGQGIPPHIDTHSAFQDQIVSLSLLSQIVMDFRHPDGTRISINLPRRSLLVMSGECRYLWSHGITPRKYDVVCDDNDNNSNITLLERSRRVSFTFRKIRHSPCNCKYPNSCDTQLNLLSKAEVNCNPCTDKEAASLEREYVYNIYDNIADHFSGTRHSPWPVIANFLTSLPEGSMVLDIGCGNGKYMNVNKSLYMVGCDRSSGLVSICGERGFEVILCDILNLPFQSQAFDACICIAVIHHLSTTKRRIEALKECIRILRRDGVALVYVWALEQDQRNIDKEKMKHNTSADLSTDGVLTNREADTGVRKFKLRHFEKQDLLVPWHYNNRHNKKFENVANNSASNQTLYHRYYHVFMESELISMCKAINNVTIRESFYDRGNWCVILNKISD
ncbi:Alkylated DNA repair protein alkB-like protein 8 [Trichoplax sp. H2]|nr:Alkylated DNA repair protein alkB-like protein 8 [Trichoplax sp. H2]|eukprot:RDD45870.1 Alkylated DNA repair protein alkB-like protein 8 [Trichoplax sp. H2]